MVAEAEFTKGSKVPPPTLVPATVAAQELRSSLRYWRDNPPASPGLPPVYKHQLEALLRDLGERLAAVETNLGPLEEAIVARRTSVGKERLTALSLSLARLRHARDQTASYLAAVPVPKKSEGVNWRQLYKLAQCLPTVEDIPTTPAENTLRAIIALLRNHRWPGSEELTQNQVKEVTNGSEAEAVKQLSDAVGPPQPVGNDPSGGIPDEDYDGDGDEED